LTTNILKLFDASRSSASPLYVFRIIACLFKNIFIQKYIKIIIFIYINILKSLKNTKNVFLLFFLKLNIFLKYI
jgi:hypothetical protein